MPFPVGVVKARTALTTNQIRELIRRVVGKKQPGGLTPAMEQELRMGLEGTPPFQTREMVPMQHRVPGTEVWKQSALPLEEARGAYLQDPRMWEPRLPRPTPATVLGEVTPGHPLETAAGISYRLEREVALAPPAVLKTLRNKLEQYPNIPGKEIATHVIEGLGAWKEFVQGIRLQKDLWKRYVKHKGKAQERFLSLYVDTKLTGRAAGGAGSPEREFVTEIQRAYPIEQVGSDLTPEELAATLGRFLGR